MFESITAQVLELLERSAHKGLSYRCLCTLNWNKRKYFSTKITHKKPDLIRAQKKKLSTLVLCCPTRLREAFFDISPFVSVFVGACYFIISECVLFEVVMESMNLTSHLVSGRCDFV